MRVEERPNKLAADVFEAEFKMGVLVNGEMPTVKGCRANVPPLFVGDFFGANQAGRVTGARGCDGGIVRMSEGVAEGNTRRRGFNKFSGRSGIEHAGLRGHYGSSLYTGGR